MGLDDSTEPTLYLVILNFIEVKRFVKMKIVDMLNGHSPVLYRLWPFESLYDFLSLAPYRNAYPELSSSSVRRLTLLDYPSS
jgi:hypothetical protein